MLEVAKELTPKWLKTCYKSAEEEIEKSRIQSRRAKNFARFQPLYGVTINRRTDILMDTVPIRVNDAAVAQPCYGSPTVTVLW